MRVVNRRLLAVLIGVGIVLVAADYLIHVVQMQRNADLFLQSAREAVELKQGDEAVRRYRLYLRLDPDNTDARAELGILLADQGAYKNAFVELEKVARLAPERRDARLRLVQVVMKIGRYTDAKEHLDFLLNDAPRDAELLDLLGRCQEAMGETEAAIESFRSAVKYAPRQVDTYARLGDLLRRLGRRAEADLCMQKMVAANPASAHAHVLRGRHLKTTGALDAAAAEASEALKLLPNDAEVLCFTAQCELEQHHFDSARQHAQRGIETNPKYAPLYTALADVEVRSGRRAEAIACLERGTQNVSDNEELLGNLANLLLDAGRSADARPVVARLRNLSWAAPLAGYLQARIEFAEGHWLAASRRLEEVRPELVSSRDLAKQIDFWLGNCYAQLGNADLQLAAYRRAAGADATWGRARLGIAAALVSIGRIDEALEEYRQIVRLPDSPPEAWLQVARLSLLKNLTASPSDRNWSQVETALDGAEKALPNSVVVPILRAELLVGQNRFSDAENLLAEARKRAPKQVDLRTSLAALLERRQQWQAADAVLEQAEKELGDSVPLRLARGQYLVRRYGNEAAVPLQKLADAKQLQGTEASELERGLAVLSLQANDYPQALRLCKILSEREPNNLQFRTLLFDLALRAQDTSAMEQTLREMERIEGQGALWHYGRAVTLWLAAQKSSEANLLDQAEEQLSQAQSLRPAWWRVPLLRAQIDDYRGRLEAAIQYYLQAIELGERDPDIIRRVVQLLFGQQRYKDADLVIRRLEERQGPFSSDLGRIAREVSLRLDDFDRALQLAQRVADSSKSYGDHIWLGQVLSVRGHRARIEQQEAEAVRLLHDAERELLEAVKLADNVPDTWVAWIQFLARLQQPQRAEEAIAQAAKKVPSASIPLTLAQCYEAIGKIEEAEKQYRAAVAASPNDVATIRLLADFCLRIGKPQAAEAELSRLTSGAIKATADDLMWGRRSQALALLSRGGYQNLQRARDLIEQNLKVAKPSTSDQRVKALVLGSYPSRDGRREALKAWATVLNDQRSVLPEDRLIVAQLYAAEDDWANAARQMRTLLAAHGQEPRYIAAYVTQLLKHNELSDAELWLQRLATFAPTAFSTASLKARALMLRGRHDEAIKTLQDFVEKGNPKAADDAVRIGSVAAALEDLARRSASSGPNAASTRYAREAEAMFRRYVEKRDQSLVLAAFLGRQYRIDEAIKLLETDWQKAPPETVAQAIAAVWSGGAPNREQLQRVEALLTAALAKHQRPTALLSAAATLYGLQERYGKAETIYQEMLDKNGDDVVALNNLATLLAAQHKQLEQARQLVDKAITIGGPAASLLDTRAVVLMAAGSYSEAVVELDQAIAEQPDPVFYLHRSQAYLQAGNKQASAESLAKARAQGLHLEHLHPLERLICAGLLESLNER